MPLQDLEFYFRLLTETRAVLFHDKSQELAKLVALPRGQLVAFDALVNAAQYEANENKAVVDDDEGRRNDGSLVVVVDESVSLRLPDLVGLLLDLLVRVAKPDIFIKTLVKRRRSRSVINSLENGDEKIDEQNVQKYQVDDVQG